MKITKNKETGKWKLDVEIIKGKRFRKTCNTRSECLNYYHKIRREYEGVLKNDGSDNRKLKDIIDIWYNGRGCELAQGDSTKRQLEGLADIVGNPEARKMSAKLFNQFKIIKRAEGVTDSTLNNYLVNLRSVYNYLIKIKEINYSNPLACLEQIKIQEKELSFLTKSEIKRLLNAIDTMFKHKDLLLVTKLCLSTGARWGEIISRKERHFANGQITLSKTKGKRVRTIPLETGLYETVKEHLNIHGSFACTRSSFRKALKKAEIELQERQCTHVLRHTFASHFMMNKGNIIVLQKILGHTDIKLTMRYAKFDPDHFQDAIRFNPLNNH